MRTTSYSSVSGHPTTLAELPALFQGDNDLTSGYIPLSNTVKDLSKYARVLDSASGNEEEKRSAPYTMAGLSEDLILSLQDQIRKNAPEFRGDAAEEELFQESTELQRLWKINRELRLKQLEAVVTALTPYENILPIGDNGVGSLQDVRKFTEDARSQSSNLYTKLGKQPQQDRTLAPTPNQDLSHNREQQSFVAQNTRPLSPAFAGLYQAFSGDGYALSMVLRLHESQGFLESTSDLRLTKSVRTALKPQNAAAKESMKNVSQEFLNVLKIAVEAPAPELKEKSPSLEQLHKHQQEQEAWIKARNDNLAKLDSTVEALSASKKALKLERTGLTEARKFSKNAHSESDALYKTMRHDTAKRILKIEAQDSKREAGQLAYHAKHLPDYYNGSIYKIKKHHDSLPKKETEVERLKAKIERNNACLDCATRASNFQTSLEDRCEALQATQETLSSRLKAEGKSYAYGHKSLDHAVDRLGQTTFPAEKVAKYTKRSEDLEKKLAVAEAKESKYAIQQQAANLQKLIGAYEAGTVSQDGFVQRLQEQQQAVKALIEEANRIKQSNKQLKTGYKAANNTMEAITANLKAIELITKYKPTGVLEPNKLSSASSVTSPDMAHTAGHMKNRNTEPVTVPNVTSTIATLDPMELTRKYEPTAEVIELNQSTHSPSPMHQKSSTPPVPPVRTSSLSAKSVTIPKFQHPVSFSSFSIPDPQVGMQPFTKSTLPILPASHSSSLPSAPNQSAPIAQPSLPPFNSSATLWESQKTATLSHNTGLSNVRRTEHSHTNVPVPVSVDHQVASASISV